MLLLAVVQDLRACTPWQHRCLPVCNNHQPVDVVFDSAPAGRQRRGLHCVVLIPAVNRGPVIRITRAAVNTARRHAGYRNRRPTGLSSYPRCQRDAAVLQV